MIKRKTSRYAILFEFFSVENIADFLKEMNQISTINYTIHESSLVHVLFPEKNKKIAKQNLAISPSTVKILNVINQFRDACFLKEICRYLEYEVYLRSNKFISHDGNENCGITVIKDGKKLDLSINNYLYQLKNTILANLEAHHV